MLGDRAFDANDFPTRVAQTGAMLLIRAKSTRTPRVLRHLPDGSYLSLLEGMKVRIIEASVTMTGTDGRPDRRPPPPDHHPARPPPLPR